MVLIEEALSSHLGVEFHVYNPSYIAYRKGGISHDSVVYFFCWLSCAFGGKSFPTIGYILKRYYILHFLVIYNLMPR